MMNKSSNQSDLSCCENRHVNFPGGRVSGGLFERLPVQPGGLLHVHKVYGLAEPHPGVRLGQPDEALQLPGVGGDLAPPGPDLPHLHVILDQLLASRIREDRVVSLFGVLDVIPENTYFCQEMT